MAGIAGFTAESWLSVWNSWDKDTPFPSIKQHCSGDSQAETSHGDHKHSHGHDHKHHGDKESHSHRHGKEVDKHLIQYLSHLTCDNTDNSIFVSLSGNTLDLGWLCDLGYSVVGAELSEIAVKGSFSNAPGGQIPYEVITNENLKYYSATDGKKMKVYVGNFFSEALVPENIGTFDCIWDCHGIISMPNSDHEPFAKKLITFLKPGGRMLFSTVDYINQTKLTSGPIPAPVPASRLQEFFPKCEVKQLANEPFPSSNFEGVDEVSNPVVLVTSASTSD